MSTPNVPRQCNPARAKGLRAESAGAVTGRRCPHSGEGEDFLAHQPSLFTKTAVTRETKSPKIVPKAGNKRSP